LAPSFLEQETISVHAGMGVTSELILGGVFTAVKKGLCREQTTSVDVTNEIDSIG
jgi:hypothetical protein